jgi:hypothetical protein
VPVLRQINTLYIFSLPFPLNSPLVLSSQLRVLCLPSALFISGFSLEMLYSAVHESSKFGSEVSSVQKNNKYSHVPEVLSFSNCNSSLRIMTPKLEYSCRYSVTSVSKTAPRLLHDRMTSNSRINQTQTSGHVTCKPGKNFCLVVV